MIDGATIDSYLLAALSNAADAGPQPDDVDCTECGDYGCETCGRSSDEPDTEVRGMP